MIDGIKVEFIPYEKIEEVANNVIAKYNLAETFPIDVDKFADNELKLNIIPFPRLFLDFEINAITSSDLNKIYMDDYLYQNLDQQYRFTLAHELGHIFLHKKIYEQAEIEGLDSYRNFMNNISKEDYESLEFQANCFAGYFLVPITQLKKEFQIKLRKIAALIQRRFKDQQRFSYIDVMIGLLAKEISPFFNVHPTVVRARIKRENLTNQIP